MTSSRILLTADDRLLLTELDADSHRSFNDIAAKLRMKKSTVAYRVARLQELQIIRGFHTVIDVGRLGLTGFRLYLKLQGATISDVAKLLRFLVDDPKVMWVVSVQGVYDIGAVVLVNEISEIHEFWQSLLLKFRPILGERHLTIMSGVHYHPRNFITQKPKAARPILILTTAVKNPEVDRSDWAILRLIGSDCRRPLAEIARAAKLSLPTVTRRIKRLEKSGVIAGYRSVFGYEALGWLYVKVHLVLLATAPARVREINTFLASNSLVIYQNDVIGGDDFEFELQAENENQVTTFLNELRQRFGDSLHSIKILKYLSEHKFQLLPF
jgi:Lrp/AsnC family transcriptional regulator, leucine-responsive regulatory protein